MTGEPSFSDRPTILVVDDTSDNLTLISSLLKDIYRVKVANNGEKALRFIQGGSQPDLILLDIMMPGLSGYDVIKELKENPQTREIPVIFLTAMTDSAEEKKALSWARPTTSPNLSRPDCAGTGQNPIAEQGGDQVS